MLEMWKSILGKRRQRLKPSALRWRNMMDVPDWVLNLASVALVILTIIYVVIGFREAMRRRRL